VRGHIDPPWGLDICTPEACEENSPGWSGATPGVIVNLSNCTPKGVQGCEILAPPGRDPNLYPLPGVALASLAYPWLPSCHASGMAMRGHIDRAYSGTPLNRAASRSTSSRSSRTV
jgi:hypothetical protein